MAARDKIYEPVLKALDNDHWIITDDPLILGYEEIRGLVDLGAERIVGAERMGDKIAMDRYVTTYQTILKQIFLDYAALLNRRPEPDSETQLVIDEERGQYILHTLGWKDKARVWNTPLYVRLHNGKIWVETDWIEEGITDKLLAAGVPKTDIVLAFQHPFMRAFDRIRRCLVQCVSNSSTNNYLVYNVGVRDKQLSTYLRQLDWCKLTYP